MDHSPSFDATFVVGADLVEFDRRDLPIYDTPHSPWAKAGCEIAAHGASLDRLFGDPGEIFVTSVIVGTDQFDAAVIAPLLIDDPMIVVTGLGDGLILPLPEHDRIGTLDDHAGVTLHGSLQLPDGASLCDFGSGGHALLPLADGWYWDIDTAGWVAGHFQS